MNRAQRSFSGGEVTPSLFGRTDQLKYATGLRTCRNFIVQRHGGVTNRPGTGFVDSTKGDGVARLVKFVFSPDVSQVYILVFTDRAMRIVQDGGMVATAGVTAWATATAYTIGDLRTNGGTTYYATADHTSGATTEPGVGTDWQGVWSAQTDDLYEIPTPYLAADLAALQVVQSADVLTIVHPSYAPRELRRTAHTRWILTPVSFQPGIGSPGTLALSGGIAGTIRYWAVTAIDGDTGEEGLAGIISSTNRVPDPGTMTGLTWNPVDGAIEYRVYRADDGSTYGLISNSGGTPAATGDTSWVDDFDSVGTALLNTWVASTGQARNAVVAAAAAKAYDGKYTISGMMVVAAASGVPDVTLGRLRAYYSRDGETRVDAGIIPGAELRLEGVGGASLAVQGTIDVPDNGYATLTLDIVPEVNGSRVSGTPAFTCSVDFTTAPNNRIDWSGNAGAVGFFDDGSAPDYTQAPPTQQAVFQATADWPAAVGYAQQRRFFADTTNDPEKVWGSRTGSYASFTTSTPLQDDDAVAFRLAGRQVNAVKHLLELDQLYMFTTGGVHEIRGDDAGTIRPSAINPRQVAYNGASSLAPLIITSAALYVQARGAVVRDFRPQAADEARNRDLTIFASHLFDGYSLVDWDYQETPNSIVWAVRSDGVLLGLTYLREHEVWGWHRHDTDGVVENVCVVPEGIEDRLYLVVRRTINGVSRRYIERMHSRAITALTDVRDLAFMDATLTYDGRNTSTTSLVLSGGTAWDDGEQLALAASASIFSAGDVGNAYFVYATAADGAATDAILVRLTIEAYIDPTHVTVRPNRLVPVASRTVAITAWAKAVDQLSGLEHLEGKAVAIFADGEVAASPNNASYDPVTVTAGSITLAAPAAVIHVGLPYVSDLETLDIDSASGPSIKETKILVNKLTLLLERSRGLFIGGAIPTGDDPVERMDELKVRDGTDGFGPIVLRTEQYDQPIQSGWNSSGRVALRALDPVPTTVLAVIPRGVFPATA